METNRQKKISSLLQQELANVLLNAVREAGVKNLVISVTKVSVTVDLSDAKVYISVYPSDKSAEILSAIDSNSHLIKHQVATITRHQIRKMPQLKFFLDDSLDYLENLQRELEGANNPVTNPELLYKRKKK